MDSVYRRLNQDPTAARELNSPPAGSDLESVVWGRNPTHVRGEYGTLKAVNSSANPSMASTCRSPQPGRPNPCRAELLARGAGSSIDLAISSSFQLLSSVVLPSSRWPTLRNPLATVDKQLQLHHPRTHAPKVCRHAPFTALPVRSWRSFTPATRAPCGFCRAQLTSLSGCQVLLRRPSPSSLIL